MKSLLAVLALTTIAVADPHPEARPQAVNMLPTYQDRGLVGSMLWTKQQTKATDRGVKSDLPEIRFKAGSPSAWSVRYYYLATVNEVVADAKRRAREADDFVVMDLVTVYDANGDKVDEKDFEFTDMDAMGNQNSSRMDSGDIGEMLGHLRRGRYKLSIVKQVAFDERDPQELEIVQDRTVLAVGTIPIVVE